MFKRKKMKQIGALLDGEPRYAGRQALSGDAEAQAYEAAVLHLRRGAAVAARTPEISDASSARSCRAYAKVLKRQLPVFPACGR